MAKNKLRKFNLDGVKYLWRAEMIDPQYLLLRVWLDGNAFKNRFVNVRLRFDDPWANFGTLLAAGSSEEASKRISEVFVSRPLTPSMVREIILAAREAGWKPETRQEQLNFEWANDTKLEKVEDATIPGEKPFG